MRTAWLTILLLGTAAPARGAVVYDVPADCPGRAQFVDFVAAREPDAARALDRYAVQVTVLSTSAGFRGAVRVEGGGAREVRAEDCGQVVEALALVLALALRDRPPPPPPVVEAPPPPDLPPPPAVPSAQPPPPAVLELSAGVGLGVVSGVVPGFSPSVPFFFEVRRQGPDRFRPAARLGFVWALGAARPEDAATADFQWLAAELEPCAGWAVSERWSVDGCLRGRLGGLRARGSDLPADVDTWRAWAEVGLAARARYDVADRWFLEADLSATAPMIRDRFFFGPDLTAHQAAPVAVFARLQAGASIW